MFKTKKGFTLIEIVVVIAVLAILVTIGSPRYLGHTQEAKLIKLKHDAKLIQDASDRYYMNNNDWPFLLDKNGERIIVTDPNRLEIIYKVQNYDESKLGIDPKEDIVLYEIDFNKLKPYIRRLDSNIAYFVAAVGNPDFGITVLDPKSKTTQERITNPSTPQDPLRQPNEDEIAINSAEDLYSIRNNLSGKYILMSDIDLSQYENWTPIGDNNNQFTGSLDGNGFKITNLKINRTADYTGLFGYTGSGAKLSNIALENADVKGGNNTGGLVGWNDSSITNSYSTGTVSGGSYTGGLVGYNGSTITNSYSTGTVSGGSWTGGLVGRNNYGSITNSYSTGTVSGGNYTGSLVGYNYYGTITNSYSTGTVTGTRQTGGLVGLNNYGTITNSYSTGTVTGTRQTGGLVGYNYYATITNSYTTGTLYGSKDGGTISGNKSNISVAEMKQKATFTNLDFTNTWEIIEDESYPFLKSNPQTPPPK